MRHDWSLSPEQKQDAREALALIGDSGLTLKSAVQIALKMGSASAQKTMFSEAVRQFLEDRKDKGLRSSSLFFYQVHLWPMCEFFEGKTLDDISSAVLAEHLQTLTPSMTSARFRAVRALWRWALKRSTPMVRRDITDALSFPQIHHRGDIRFLSVRETELIMRGAGEYRHAAALMLFAGIRPEEVRGRHKPALRWENIDRDARLIRIPSDVAKTKQPRILENLPDNLWSWLADGPEEGPICKVEIRAVVMTAQKLAGFRDSNGQALRKWPQDAMRHSFATYHVALLADPGRTSLLLGHEGTPSMLYRHYRGLATKSQAEKYFDIMSH